MWNCVCECLKRLKNVKCLKAFHEILQNFATTFCFIYFFNLFSSCGKHRCRNLSFVVLVGGFSLTHFAFEITHRHSNVGDEIINLHKPFVKQTLDVNSSKKPAIDNSRLAVLMQWRVVHTQSEFKIFGEVFTFMKLKEKNKKKPDYWLYSSIFLLILFLYVSNNTSLFSLQRHFLGVARSALASGRVCMGHSHSSQIVNVYSEDSNLIHRPLYNTLIFR